ncbi:uncharacterized protein At3g06530-like isoform X1 [Brassica napus]|uniref:uncharacterized protein At3g06530-like isoform X1 n=1 Tax=Brassica napus TaxID=3708 RepID=UPI0020787719|nr:uncharacterized protein At3g06530-like isoform X1 [Brassica napus]
MSSLLASQLQAIKAVVQADTEPSKRPYTRPSILFTPKEAADFDIESIYKLGLKGLEVLGNKDERFKNFVSDLFSHKSREIDRELLGKEENAKIDASISSYLRLLSGYLQFRASLETLEYLIRRYKVHIYNVEDVVLCALPYHDTHAFVRIVQLISTGNTKWKFLDGVKNSGAPPPRSVIVQQCIRDTQILEALCDYGSRTKKYQPSKPVVSFTTAVVVEVLGSVAKVDGDIVKLILPFVDSGLQSAVKGCLDQQAGALMVVGMLANRASLNDNLIKRFMRSIIDVAREHAKESSDPHWLRLSFMALINLVQLQSVDLIPKKALDLLKEIRDISGVLLGLSKEFNIKKFLTVLLDSLLLYCSSDDQCLETLISIIDSVPVENLVDHLISKVFSTCMTQYQKNKSDLTSSTSGSWAKKILAAVSKKYSVELRAAVQKFMEDTKGLSKKEDLKLEMLSRMLDGNSDMSLPFVDSKLWFRLHHPKAAVRCAALSSLNGDLKRDISKAENLVTIQDAIVRQLWDDDLAVVQAALSLDQLPNIVTSSSLLDALLHVVKRCVGIIQSGLAQNVQLAADVVALSLKIAVSSFCNQPETTEKVASAMFPFLLVLPKTLKLNLNVLTLGKDVNWPLFKNLGADDGMKKLPIMSGNISSISMDIINSLGEALSLKPDERRIELIESSCNFKLSEVLESCSNIKLTEQERNKLQEGLLIRESVSALNMDVVNKLVEAFIVHPSDVIQWLTVTCHEAPLAKTLFFVVLMQSLHKMSSSSDPTQFLDLFELCFPVLKTEWEELDVAVEVSLKELSKSNCQELLYQLSDTSDFTELNSKILICLFWKLVESFIKLEPAHVSSVFSERLCSGLEDLFIFFATTRSQHVFKEHLHYRVREAKVCPVLFLTRLLSREDVPRMVRIESLKCFSYLCSNGNSEWSSQIFFSFPVLLVAISSDNQDVKVAAMNCFEALYNLWCRVDSSNKNGSAAIYSSSFDELLGMIVQQRRLILSDNKFLPSYLTSLLSSTPYDLLVPVDLQKRFDQPTKESILSFILLCAQELPAYGKLRVISLLKGLGISLLHGENVKLLSQLLDKRSQYYIKLDRTSPPMSDTEVDLLCLLLECSMMRSALFKGQSLDDDILNALKMDRGESEHPAVISPCLTILEKLSNQYYAELKTEVQIRFFLKLVSMFRSTNGRIQTAAKEAVLRLKISCSTVIHTLDHITQQDNLVIDSLNKKKKQKKSVSCPEEDVNGGELLRGEKALCFIASLLDMLLLKKDQAHRESLVGPLFKLLGRSMSDEWVKIASSAEETSVEFPQDVREITHASISSIQETVLLLLKDIFDSPNINPLKADITNEIDVKMLVEFAHSSNDVVIRNYIFSLFTSIVKIVPDRVLDHIISILTLVGESTVTQIDSHSKSIFEEFISSVIPFWLSKTKSEEQLLEIFVKVLPDIVEHRRRSIVAYLLGVIGEQNGLPSLLVLLFKSLISRKDSAWLGNVQNSDSFISDIKREWEYAFAVEICEQYTSSTWLSSLVMLLQTISKDSSSKECLFQMRLVLEFMFEKLQDPEFAFAVSLEPRTNVSVGIQQELQELMKGCILLLQAVDSTKEKDVTSAVRKEIRMRIHDVLMTVTGVMDLSIYFRVVTSLLQQQSDRNGTRKVLGLISARAKDSSTSKPKHKKRLPNQKRGNPWLNLDEAAVEAFGKMCEEIVNVIVETDEDSDVPAKRAAISTLEVLASRLPSGHPIFSKCLASVAQGISSKNLGVSSSCLRTTGALINVLGPKALVELPRIMKNLVQQSSEVSSASTGNATAEEQLLMMSVLVTLEAVIEKLGGFLNPHLGDIIRLMVLHREYVSDFDKNLKSKANAIRRLLTEKIPVRLTLQPLLRIYDEAVSSGDASLVIAFDMLENLVAKMDRASVVCNHAKIFDQCLAALDIRRQNPATIQNVDDAERSVINATVTLTKKLTESEFKPLFIRSIDWAESEIVDGSGNENKSVDRSISFYGLVNRLCKAHTSIFVPYFKFMLDGIVSHLTSAAGASVSTRKKKKAKIQETDDTLPPKSWHLRALVLSCLNNCFLHDIGSLKFLDANNFQVLLKPIVSQLVVEPPSGLKELPNVPSVEEVDELLVTCVGQMAVASGSDLLWKPLNHEVLMQTRSEKLRARLLSLRSVKQMMDNLKEEYLVLLAETIPFLGELLEDVDLSVKSLSQDIITKLEVMSGEDLAQHL